MTTDAGLHGDARRLAEEQAALRRVATVVAAGGPDSELFACVAREVAQVLGVRMVTIDRYESDASSTVVASVDDPAFPVGSRWPLDGPSLGATVLASGRPARVDDYSNLESTAAAAARDALCTSTVGVPIVVDGAVWGVICVGTMGAEPLPGDTEERLAGFTELIGGAISSTDARNTLRRLLDEQEALRRVATLVADGVAPGEVFSAVAEEVVRLFDVAAVTLNRYEADATVVIADPQDTGFPVGSRWPLDGESLAARVLATGRTARIDDYSELPGAIAAAMRASPWRSAVGVPIVVDGTVWGVLTLGSQSPEALPADTEARVAGFTDLVATSIVNSEARESLRVLVDEQAALRRVATLVAERATAAKLFSTVAEEVGRVLGVPGVSLDRYEPDGSSTVLAVWGEAPFPVGTHWPVEPGTISGRVFETAAAARIDDYSTVRGRVATVLQDTYPKASIVGVPIVVEGRVWGMMGVGSPWPGILPADTEVRLAHFTELVATAIANTAARDSLRTLVDEQAALRRVATLVAEGVSNDELFAVVAEEVGRVVGVPGVTLDVYEPDGSATVVLACWQSNEKPMWPVGSRWPLDGPSVAKKVWETGRPATMEDYPQHSGAIAERYRARPKARTIGVPIVVDGKVWGLIAVGSTRGEEIATDAEERLVEFTELLATAISNTTARSELIASRARIVAAGDEARRRIERNLHDGTQQQLIALGLELQAVRATVPPELRRAHEGFERMEREIDSVLEDVRELSRGLHPALLARAGLGPSLKALARRSPIYVDFAIETGDERPPEPVETGVYYVVSEGLANAIKHSQATRISVTVSRTGSILRATIEDDGVGGAEAGSGSGLTGMIDRVEALGGRFALTSPRGAGTRVTIELPFAGHDLPVIEG